jgi:hypothetical protein
MNKLSVDERKRVVAALVEGNFTSRRHADDWRPSENRHETSLRSWPRLLGISGQNISQSELAIFGHGLRSTLTANLFPAGSSDDAMPVAHFIFSPI